MTIPCPDHPDASLLNKFEGFDGLEEELTAEGLFNLAHWFDESGMPEKAIEFYKKSIKSNPQLAAAHHNLAIQYLGRPCRDKAVHHLELAVKFNPGLAESYSALGMIYFGEDRFEAALALLEQAVTVNPEFAGAQFNLGVVLQQTGAYDRSIAAFQKASACNPGFAPARWLHKLCLPMLYNNQDEIAVVRQRFSENLDDLIRTVQLDSTARIDYALAGIQSTTNFYLQYQGHNDLALQTKYGKWIHRIMSLRYPQWASCPNTTPPRPGEKIRIGYVSAYMNRHTVGTFLAGWVENHSKDKFEVHCYHLGPKCDDLTQHLSRHSHRFHHISGNYEAAAAQIASDRLHILVYNEIGMNVEAMLMAALRLSPVQCVGWGHPITSGLPSIDYFLSSDLMEPENSDRYYSERLIRLPNLSLCYHPPRLPKKPLDRKALGIPADRFVFLSSQSVYKYLPQHDDIYPFIAKKAPNAFFVFISHRNQFVTKRLMDRLRRAFKRHYLDFDRFCHFSPRLNAEEFMSLNMAADVFLDTLEWSGGKTTLEAISAGLPVVTLPGRFMRGRHAYAMLKRMGIEETIARDKTSYCAIAARLATDRGYFNAITKRFNERRDRLYNDHTFMAALEKRYLSMVRNDQAIPLNNKEMAEKWFQTANTLLKQMDVEQAISAYGKTLEIQPNWDAAHYNLAVALHLAGNEEQAIHHAKQAIETNPDYANAFPLLYRLAQHVCDWPLVEETSERLDRITRSELSRGAKTTEPPMTNLRRSSDIQLNYQVARSWSRQIAQSVQQQPPLPNFDAERLASRRIRVGYLSADFKDHAVAYQVKGLLEHHDRNKFEIFGYAINPDDGTSYRRQLTESCDQFRDVHAVSNRLIAEQIRNDGIHILMDMAGHSKDNRLGIAALRPAPVQVSYLGFLGTTGADFMDYVLADELVVPKAHRPYYSEKVVYLPHCYQANDDQLAIAPQKHQRSDWALPEDAFVYCGFNQPYKIDARLFQTWMRILKRVDKGVLWLVERSERARENLLIAAKNAGVDPDRLIFTGFVPMDKNLARLQMADLMLDTLIYNGGATTSNALWAGVPVITTLGSHWVSRMSASALHCIGLDELIAEDLDQYEQIAVELAIEPERLKAVRDRLLVQRSESPLFDTALFTRHAEKAYQVMWNRFAAGEPSKSFYVTP